MAAPAPPYGQTEYSQAPPANTHYEQPVPQEQYHQQEPAYPPAAGGAPVGEALPAPGVYVPPQEHAHVHDHGHAHAHPHAAGAPTATGTTPDRGPVQPWNTSFWGCCSPMPVCCLGYWCPCILFGRTRHRIQEPSLGTYKALNKECVVCFAIGYIGCGWVYQMLRRSDLRDDYNLAGSFGGDCFRPFCCPCCELIQEEKEVISRTQGADATTTTTTTTKAVEPQGYQAPNTEMKYGA